MPRVLLCLSFLTFVALASELRGEEFPSELVDFVPYAHNPVFAAAGAGDWDARLRERGWILREGQTYRMWYTGYDGQRTGKKMLGYALSTDGLHWTRHPDNPLYSTDWVEDMTVVKHDGVYYMFAEGQDDIAQLLTSPDGLRWTRVGPLDIRLKDGKEIPPGPRGTPAVWIEDGVWHLFYERNDKGVWLATSRDRKVWTNADDQPVLACGPELYDRGAVAMNQIVKHQGKYYGYYHGSDSEQPGRKWSTSVAVSSDLRLWLKYSKNPIVADNQSSGILVNDGARYRLYTMHDQVRVYFPRQETPPVKKAE